MSYQGLTEEGNMEAPNSPESSVPILTKRAVSCSPRNVFSRPSQMEVSNSPENVQDDMAEVRKTLFTEQVQGSRKQINGSITKKRPRKKFATSSKKKIKISRKLVESSSAAKEASSLSNYDEYNGKSMDVCISDIPIITNIKQVDMLNLANVRRRVQVIGTEKQRKLQRKYFHGYNNVINMWRKQKQRILLRERKKYSYLVYFILDFTACISSELGKTELNPQILLKTIYYFLLNAENFSEKNVSIKTIYVDSLKMFLTNTAKCTALHYLLKDIAADILSKLDYIYFNDTSYKQLIYKFCSPDWTCDDFYGTVLTWLSNITPGMNTKLVQHFVAECNYSLISRFLTCPRIFYKLISALESCTCCVSGNAESVSSAEKDSLCTKLDNLSLKQKNPLYDLNLVNNMNILIRHETNYTPLFHMKYEPRISFSQEPLKHQGRPLNSSNMLLLEFERKILSKFSDERQKKIKEKIQYDSCKPLKEEMDLPRMKYMTYCKKSYIEDDNFYGFCDLSSHMKTPPIHTQHVYCCYLPVRTELNYNAFSIKDANTYRASVSFVKPKQNKFSNFKFPDLNQIIYKPSRKKNLSPS